MKNRLFWQRLLLFIFIKAAFLGLSPNLGAQSFTLNYSGLDTIYVGDDCRTLLDWGHPNTISFVADSGNKIDTFYIDTISGGFNIGDTLSVGTEAFISYYVEDTTGVFTTLDSVLRIVIADNTAPFFDSTALPNDTSYNYYSEVLDTPALTTILAMDNCGIQSIIYSGESARPSICTGGTFTRTWTAVDSSGNNAIYIQNITINSDTTKPVWTTDPTDLMIACHTNRNDTINAWLAAHGNGMAIDSSDVTITNNFVNFVDSCNTGGGTVVTFTARDSCGNMEHRTAAIILMDTLSPIIDIMAMDTTINCNNAALSFTDWLTNHGFAQATDFCTSIDNSSASTHWSVVDIDTTLDCGNTATYAVTFEVRDDCGNADSTMATFVIIDTLPPDIQGIISDTTELCGGGNDANKLEQWFEFIKGRAITDECSDSLSFVRADYTDKNGQTGSWSGLSVPFPVVVPQFDCQWYIDVAFIFEDDCGNQGLDSARFFLIDTLQPVLVNVPKDTIVECDNIPLAATNITATDNCDTTLMITLSEVSDTSSAIITITRTWGTVDDCNNSITASQTITLIDTTAPVIMGVPADTMVSCHAIPAPPAIDTAITAMDNCGDSTNIILVETSTKGDNPDSCQAYSYILTRTWIATDAYNNSDSTFQIITVIDTTAPTFIMPVDTIISCELRDSLSVTGEPSKIEDNCDTIPAVSFIDLVIGGDCIGGGALDTIRRTWIVADACGNTSQGMQRIILIDTIAPIIIGQATDTSLQCSGEMIPLPAIGTDITASDNCTDSPLIQFLGETTTKGTDLDSCDFYNYTLTRTWRATDACGNTDDFTQMVVIIDTVAPTIICPSNFIVDNTSGNCTGEVALPIPYYFDDCTGISGRDSLSLTQNFTNSSGGDVNSTPIDALVFNFNIGATAFEKTITGTANLTILLNSVDAEGNEEIFSIIGEDGAVLGGTNFSNTQCGNSSTTINLTAVTANSYAADSVITIRLVPNGTGTDAINNICTGGNANLILEYNYELPSSSIELSYKVDGGAEMAFPPTTTTVLNNGSHIITYFATDCSGNKSSCSYTITVGDISPPTFDCPGPMLVFTAPNSCETSVQLPFPTNFEDNCGFMNSFDFTISKFIQFKTDANTGLIPQDLTDTFQVNAPNAVGAATLRIDFTGDHKDTGEFFNIFGENGTLIGTTVLGDTISECATAVSTIFTIPKDTLNAWAADGNVIITAIPNQDAATFSDFINPCNILNTNNLDGVSQLSMELSFPNVTVNYTIIDEDSVEVGAGFLTTPNNVATENLSTGINRVTYSVSDAAGNTGACLFLIEVRDTIPPSVQCNPSFVVSTNPSGRAATDLSLIPDSLIGNLGDNCGIESIAILPNEISCNNSGLVTATVTVTDSSGNAASCATEIQVITESLDPTFSVGACDNDTLYLFADTSFQTPSDPGTVFTYQWIGPDGFASNEANPFIPAVRAVNSGTYSLTVTGATGCTSGGSVFVDINSLDIPPILAVKNTVCANEGIVLTTSTVNCIDLEYQWYEVIERDALPDTVILAGTSMIPAFTIENPAPGRHLYYLIVNCDECSSQGSTTVGVTVFEVPEAVTSEEIINICEGETISLSTPIIDQSCTYRWVGPGFASDLPVPPLITDVNESNEGVYTLTISKNGCTSEDAFTVVNITPSPTQPSIANDSGTPICEETELVLKTNISSASTYNWTNNTTFATYSTTSPALRIDATSIRDAGDWTLNVELFGCTSEESIPVTVVVEAKPAGTPFFEGIACEGKNINLNVNPVIAGATYQWEDAEGSVFFGVSPEVSVKTQYELSITSANNCVSTKTLDINVKETPIITTIFDSGDAIPCIIPDNTDIRILSDVFPANDGTYTYTWTLPDGTTVASGLDSVLLIPNASATAVNGIYSLVVNTGAGCASNPATNIVEVVDIPTPNPTIVPSATSLCEGQSLTLQATEYGDFSAEYRWQITSVMDTITQSPVLIIDSVTTALNGIVTLQVYNGICPSIATASLNIDVNNEIARPIINPVSTFCAGAAITLSTAEVFSATYLWEGPNFSATSSTPNIVVAATATLENSGGYTVQILANGCTSPKSEPLSVTVTAVPPAPVVNNSGDICLGSAADFILFIDEAEPLTGAVFRWFNANTSELVAGPNAFKSQIIEVGNLSAGTYRFFATQTINGCESAPSNITEVTIADIPMETAKVCQDSKMICTEAEATICAEAPIQGIGTWTTDDASIAIINPNSPIATIRGYQPGEDYTFTWTLSNGVCGDYASAQLNVSVGLSGSIAQVCESLIEECEDNTVTLCANPVLTGFSGRWSQPSSQAALGVTIDSPDENTTTVSTIEAGSPYNAYTFWWTVTDSLGVCPAIDTVEVNVYDIPSEFATILDEQLISCNGETVVSASPPSAGLTGTWSSLEATVEISNPNNSSTTIRNLSPGMNTLIWSLNSGACMDYSSDEISIFFEQTPIAKNDIFTIAFGGSAIINVTENDQLFSPDFELIIINEPTTGSITVNENGEITYTAGQNFVGSDEFTYQLCNATCTTECSIATVSLEVGKNNNSCVVPTIITPNGDNVNDAFVIPCIATGNFPRNEVIIFNQWGDELFRASPYNNDWRGTYNGEDVPAGTYYYVISYDRNTEPTAGFLVIER